MTRASLLRAIAALPIVGAIFTKAVDSIPQRMMSVTVAGNVDRDSYLSSFPWPPAEGTSNTILTIGSARFKRAVIVESEMNAELRAPLETALRAHENPSIGELQLPA